MSLHACPHVIPAASDVPIAAFRTVPRTGVIFVTDEARRLGYGPRAPGWCNLGQGMPETGPIAGGRARPVDLPFDPDTHEYAPVAGIGELREAVAVLYNRLFRRGMASQYSAENVAISPGGRAALTRAAAALTAGNLGHFVPDYTAYEQLLETFRACRPVPMVLRPDTGYAFSAHDLDRAISQNQLVAVLLSNPCNPTGKLVCGRELAEWVAVAARSRCALLMDEFYSHYVFRGNDDEPLPIVSAARYVEDVDRDPIVIFDGLTKNWRCPGWRMAWTIGPRPFIEAISNAGSFLDGGATKPLQQAALPLLDPELALAETTAIQAHFARKRELLLDRVRRAGLHIDREPDATFYLWASVAQLPETLSNDMAFFRAGLERKVISVPGRFFDIDPDHRRRGSTSPFHRHVRLSFGPSHDVVSAALDRIEAMIATAR